MATKDVDKLWEAGAEGSAGEGARTRDAVVKTLLEDKVMGKGRGDRDDFRVVLQLGNSRDEVVLEEEVLLEVVCLCESNECTTQWFGLEDRTDPLELPTGVSVQDFRTMLRSVA